MKRPIEKRKSTKSGQRELSRSNEKRGKRGRQSARAKDPEASEKRRELSQSRSRESKGRLPRSGKKEKKQTSGRELSSRQQKEEPLARADSYGLPNLSSVGEMILDMLLRKVTLNECVDICWYVVNGPAAKAALGSITFTCQTCSKRFESQACLEKHVQSKHPTAAQSSSARAVPHTRPRTQPVQDRKSRKPQPALEIVLDGNSSSYYTSSESESDHGVTCAKAENAETVDSAIPAATAKQMARALRSPQRLRERWRELKKLMEVLGESEAQPL
jgi:hypothetical protein